MKTEQITPPKGYYEPFTIAKTHVKEGGFVREGTKLYTLYDTSDREVIITAPFDGIVQEMSYIPDNKTDSNTPLLWIEKTHETTRNTHAKPSQSDSAKTDIPPIDFEWTHSWQTVGSMEQSPPKEDNQQQPQKPREQKNTKSPTLSTRKEAARKRLREAEEASTNKQGFRPGNSNTTLRADVNAPTQEHSKKKTQEETQPKSVTAKPPRKAINTQTVVRNSTSEEKQTTRLNHTTQPKQSDAPPKGIKLRLTLLLILIVSTQIGYLSSRVAGYDPVMMVDDMFMYLLMGGPIVALALAIVILFKRPGLPGDVLFYTAIGISAITVFPMNFVPVQWAQTLPGAAWITEQISDTTTHISTAGPNANPDIKMENLRQYATFPLPEPSREQQNAFDSFVKELTQ